MSIGEFFRVAWDWKPTVVAGCAALSLAYCWTLRFRFTRRSAFWFCGVLLIAAALLSPADELADRYLFSVHMAKHIVLVLIVPALLLLGLPAEPVEQALKHKMIRSVQHILRNPAVAWPAGVGAMAIWHIPTLFNAALAHEGLHVFEHLSLLVGGTIYWWPVLSPVPRLRLKPVPQAAAYLFTSCLACTSIGVLITFAPVLLYPAYASPTDPFAILPVIRTQWGVSPAMDQQIGGLLMWVPACFVYLSAIMAMFARWYAEETAAAVEA